MGESLKRAGILAAVLFWTSPADSPFAQATPAGASSDPFKDKVQPFLQKYCFACHGPQLKPKADLNLSKYSTEKSVQENRKIWKEILAKLHTREMPPEDKPQPAPDERELVTGWIEAALNKIDPSSPRNAGRVVARRLNRLEYRQTVRHLMGVDFTTTGDFPADDIGYGFDNIGDVLTLPPLLMERYLAASKKVVDEAVVGRHKGRLIFTVNPEDYKTKREAAKELLGRFLLRAFRRNPTGEEVERYTKLFDAGEKQDPSFEGALKLPLRAVLISPHFLFRVEQEGAADAWPVGDFELASRLSYFLWSSMPDDDLLELARKGGLRSPKTFEEEIRRMIEDPKSIALAENFATQWLQVRRLESMTFDARQFAAFDPQLRQDMIHEVVRFFDALVREDRSVLDLLDADFTFLSDRLARHYGLPGGNWQRVKLSDPRRGGILTMGAVLAATSDPNRTSPVKRGKWVLETILGIEPPPPIPDAANLKEEASAAGLTLRQRMERHRQDPNCASCHKRMDPIGFGFENYDATGAWRDRDGGQPIDNAATLPDGKSFKGPVELKALLRAKKSEFVVCLTEKLLTFGLGRGVEHFDGGAVKDISDKVARGGYKFSTLVIEIAKSYPFQYRQRDARVKR